MGVEGGGKEEDIGVKGGWWKLFVGGMGAIPLLTPASTTSTLTPSTCSFIHVSSGCPPPSRLLPRLPVQAGRRFMSDPATPLPTFSPL
ncbi:hypothetical protein E2C01_087347 [Portunus trituberculatus]|uniref:Uncharacterized protein n=1 Tax=Portunus trituberculatus TaxID=210409 RepID=A0A5B7JH13_PORTR|nr:hypothetical protein [Portunus trituberculatus]